MLVSVPLTVQSKSLNRRVPIWTLCSAGMFECECWVIFCNHYSYKNMVLLRC